MDAADIDMQVLSLNSPGIEQADVAEQIAFARETNDFLLTPSRRTPKRFAGLAALPVAAPEQAADELDRRVRQQGFKGQLHERPNHAAAYRDGSSYWPIIECAEALNVPASICIRRVPRRRSSCALVEFSGCEWILGSAAVLGLAYRDRGSSHSYDARRGFRSISQTASRGRAPRRRDPFMLPRLTETCRRKPPSSSGPLGAYLREMSTTTFAGFRFRATFLDLLLEVGVDRIMFSVDYP